MLAWWQRNDPVEVVVMDVNLGGIDGVTTAERLCGANVVMITSHPRPTVLKRAMAAGVRGFVPKTSSADEVAAAIRAVYEENATSTPTSRPQLFPRPTPR